MIKTIAKNIAPLQRLLAETYKERFFFIKKKQMKRKNISSGAKWEDIVGYSRAVRVGSIVEVAGTTAVNAAGEVVAKGDAFAQTMFIFEKIEKALAEADASLADVVRTRMFVTNIEDWEAIGKAHGSFFKLIKPAATMVEVARLIHPDLLIEIEVSAVLETKS